MEIIIPVRHERVNMSLRKCCQTRPMLQFLLQQLVASLVLAIMGQTRLSWTRIGYHGLDQAIMDQNRLSWARICYPGLQQAIMGQNRLSWARLGYHGLEKAIMGQKRLSWARLGYHGLGQSKITLALIQLKQTFYSRYMQSNFYK